MKPGTPPATNRETSRLGTDDTTAGKSPGRAPVHPRPRQYVIQRKLRGAPVYPRVGDPFRTSAARTSDPHSNRRQPHRATGHLATARRTPAISAATRTQGTGCPTGHPVHPVSRNRAARSGIAIIHRKRLRIQSATRLTSRIRWFLRSIPEPVEYSQYTMPRHFPREYSPRGLPEAPQFVKCCFPGKLFQNQACRLDSYAPCPVLKQLLMEREHEFPF